MALSHTTSIARSRTADPDVLPGYRLETLIGKGGMGEVYKAQQLSLDRPVAIKLLNSELARDESFVARFEKEGAALASLSHPNIVSIVDKGKKRDLYFLVMEFVNGPSLREVLRDGNLRWAQALKIILDITRAIDHAHRRGIIHRDLKPENILFDDNAGGIPKVTDFGLAGFVKGEGEKKYALTETNISMGTVAYMAPEQQIDAKAVDGRADIYSLGVMLYELLVGDVPRGNFDAPSVLKPGIDKLVDGIVARCLKASPEDRYQSAAQLIADLEPLVVQNSTLPAPSQHPMQRLLFRMARAGRLALRVASVGLVLGALFVLGVGILRGGQERPLGWQPAARAAAGELPPGGLLTVAGKLAADDDHRRLQLGEGDEKIPVLALGRPARLVDGALAFGPDAVEREPGRASPEVADLDGESATISAMVAEPTPPSGQLFASAREALLDVTPQPRSALMLLGTSGRYLAVVVPARGLRTSLEWSLGDRQGMMLGPAVGEKDPRLELTVDRDGEVRASFDDGTRRPIGEPLRLGHNWQHLLGGAPKPTVACLVGQCRFKKVAFEARRENKPEPRDPPKVAEEPRKTSPKPAVAVKEPPRVEPKVARPAPAPAPVRKPEPAKRPVAKKPEPVRKPAPAPKRR